MCVCLYVYVCEKCGTKQDVDKNEGHSAWGRAVGNKRQKGQKGSKKSQKCLDEICVYVVVEIN